MVCKKQSVVRDRAKGLALETLRNPHFSIRIHSDTKYPPRAVHKVNDKKHNIQKRNKYVYREKRATTQSKVSVPNVNPKYTFSGKITSYLYSPSIPSSTAQPLQHCVSGKMLTFPYCEFLQLFLSSLKQSGILYSAISWLLPFYYLPMTVVIGFMVSLRG